MNSKEHVLRLAVVERELRNLSDAEMTKLIGTCPDEVQRWLTGISGSDSESVDLEGLRGALKRGRMKGMPDKVSAAITDTCLQDCVTALGDNADLPSAEQLMEVTPGLVERHGRAAIRLMFASAALLEAPAANAIAKILKSDPALTA